MGPAIDKTPGVSEAALPAQQRRRDELMAQMGASGPRQAINQANSMSIIMDPTQSIGTPVRVIQQGVPRTPMPKDVKATVVSPSGFERTIKTTQSTREELTAKLLNAGVDPDRVEQIVNKTRPFAKGPAVVPAPTAPTIELTPSQSLGRKAADVANRETAPSIDPELVSEFSRQIGNRINRRLGKSPFDATLDTTSQKYLENIGKYQQFIDLDEASKAALGLYGENVKQYYADLNRQLRTGSSANLTPQQIAVNEFLQSNLNRTLDALPSEQKDLYRAIKDPTREGLTNLKIGDIYTDKGFGSFSADERAALKFIRKDAPSALITVQNAEGKNIGPVMEFDEAEFLQKPGAQYRLEAVDEIFSPKVGGNVPNYKFTQVRSQSRGQNIGGYLPIPIPTGSQLKQLAPKIIGQLPFNVSSAIEPLQRGQPTKALEEVAKGTAIGMATDPIVKPIMSRLIPAVGSVAAAAPVATTAAAAVASELAAPRAAQGGPERVTVNGTPYWLDKKANKVYTNDGRPTSFGVDIRGGKPQLVPRGQGAGTKRAAADPIRQAMQGNLMPALNMLNPMSQLLRFSNSAMKTIRGEV
jgi:hypothetical protein